MNTNNQLIVLMPIIAIIVFISIEYLYEILVPNNCSVNLFIAILSQRNHFNKRQTLRETWIQTIQQINNNNNNQLIKSYNNCRIELKARFIIGSKDCPIHPLLRTTPYSCAFNQIKVNQNNSEINLFEFNAIEEQLFSDKNVFRGFSFVIRQSIVVTRIGIHRNFVSKDNNITIVLLNGQNKEILKSIEISLNSFNANQVFYEDIKPIVLAKDFYGVLIIDNQLIDYNHYYNSNVTLNQNGFIDVLRAYYGFTDYESIAYSSNQFIGPILIYKASDQKEIQFLMKSSEKIQIKWKNELIKTSDKLSEEMILNKDIIFIDSVDIYRNLAEKVLQSIGLAIESHDLSHYLKTDDDCYLNINNIVTHLLQNRQLKKVWFGNFRRLWPTDRWGKWAENDYDSPFYPPFACGSGYLLSADLVKWIASNINHLHRFQGEDVSMGIWMSALNPLLNDDKRWVCSASDFNLSQSFSFPQLDEKQIIKIHNFILKDNKH